MPRAIRLAVVVCVCVASLFMPGPAGVEDAVWTASARPIPTAHRTTTAPPTPADLAVEHALSVLGTPYVWGGAAPGGFDCSGLVHWAYLSSHRWLPRTAAAQYEFLTRVPFEERRAGDVVFYANTYGWGVSHVGIYVGGDLVAMALSEGKPLSLVPLYGGYWGDHLYALGRVP